MPSEMVKASYLGRHEKEHGINYEKYNTEVKEMKIYLEDIQNKYNEIGNKRGESTLNLFVDFESQKKSYKEDVDDFKCGTKQRYGLIYSLRQFQFNGNK